MEEAAPVMILFGVLSCSQSGNDCLLDEFWEGIAYACGGWWMSTKTEEIVGVIISLLYMG